MTLTLQPRTPLGDSRKGIAPDSVALAVFAGIANEPKHHRLTAPSHAEGGYVAASLEQVSTVRDLPQFTLAVIDQSATW